MEKAIVIEHVIKSSESCWLVQKYYGTLGAEEYDGLVVSLGKLNIMYHTKYESLR